MRDSRKPQGRRAVSVLAGGLALLSLALAPGAAGATGGPKAAAAIVGGGPTSITNVPYQVAIVAPGLGSELDRQYCGGSLIRPRVVLTAAHCLVSPAPVPTAGSYVVSGRTQLSGGGGTQDPIVNAIVDPAYNPSTQTNDAGVVLLANPVPASSGSPIKLAGPDEMSLWRAGKGALISGWGRTSEGGSRSDVLKAAIVPIVSDPICFAIYGGAFFSSVMVCAGYPQGGVDACQGDSGGPLAVPAHGGDGGFVRQAGVTSNGAGCARPGLPGIYSRVGADPLRSFIQDAVNAGPDPGNVIGSGGSFPCDNLQGRKRKLCFCKQKKSKVRRMKCVKKVKAKGRKP